jgi:type IV secretory pathway VirJ component
MLITTGAALGAQRDRSADSVGVEAHASRAGQAPADTDAVTDLPLVEVPSSEPGRAFAVLITGDGGWAAADKELSSALVAHGVPVVGLNSPRYISRARSPNEISSDLARILRHYGRTWARDEVVVIGYSRGADLAPFMISRLPDDLRRRIALVALLGPSEWAGFQFHVIDLVKTIHRDGDLAVAPEIAKLKGTPVLCIYGNDDHDAICPSLDSTLARPILREGGHRVDGREGSALADTILRALSDSAEP